MESHDLAAVVELSDGVLQVLVVDHPVVAAAERYPAREVGRSACLPRVEMVDLAPREGAVAALGGALVVPRREGDALSLGVEALLPAEVEGGATRRRGRLG